MKIRIALLSLCVVGMAAHYIPRGGPVLEPGLTFAQINNPTTASGAATWGLITGTLSSQTDLQNALNLLAPLASPTFTGTVTLPTVTNTGAFTNSANGASSAPQFNITGSCFVGTGTTSTPCFYINQGTAPTTWSTSTGGTLFGLNAVSGFAGNFIDFHINGGASLLSVGSAGNIAASSTISTGSGAAFNWSTRSRLLSPADGIITLTPNAGNNNAFTRLQWGGSTTSFPALCVNGLIVGGCLGDGTAGSIFLPGASTVRVASNFTTAANTNLQTITGLSWTVPATGTVTASFECDLSYSQATANAAVAFGIQAATASPSNIYATGTEQITVGPPATYVSGTLATLASTTATNIVSGTPGATATNYTVHLAGTIENAATTANTFNIMVSTATSGDAVTVLRGSNCTLK